MNHEMRINTVFLLCSLLLEIELTLDQRVVMEMILKSCNLIETLISNVLDLSSLEDGSLVIDVKAFNLHGILQEVDQFVLIVFMFPLLVQYLVSEVFVPLKCSL